MNAQLRSDCTGFTLVEMAVVMMIVSLLLGGLLVPLRALTEQRGYSDTRRAMDDMRQALLGYAMAHGYLPCPAKSYLDGAENRDTASGKCRVLSGNVSTGFLPWAELGLARLDAWGHLYRYSVSAAYADALVKVTLSPLTARSITVKSRDPAGTEFRLTTDDNKSPAAVLSMGANGALAYGGNGVQSGSTSATNADEQANALGDSIFFSRDRATNESAAGGEFDDIVVWKEPGVYASKMVEAGQLP